MSKCVAALIGSERTDNVVRLSRANNPQIRHKAELLVKLLAFWH